MKNICILLLVITFLSSCKTSEKIASPEAEKPPIMQAIKVDLDEQKDAPPRDLNDLIRQMALTAEEKEMFLGFYKEAGQEIASMLVLGLDKKEEKKRRGVIYKTRDNNVRSILNPNQKKMYDRYIYALKRRKKSNQSNGTEINY